MLEQLSETFVPPVVAAVELIGVAIIAIGVFLTLGQFLIALLRRQSAEAAIGSFRSRLGRVILIGLEFLVAADIINTVVVDLSLENVLSLAVIVLVRTLLSFSLEAEIEGRWPWQRAKQEQRKTG